MHAGARVDLLYSYLELLDLAFYAVYALLARLWRGRLAAAQGQAVTARTGHCTTMWWPSSTPQPIEEASFQ